MAQWTSEHGQPEGVRVRKPTHQNSKNGLHFFTRAHRNAAQILGHRLLPRFWDWALRTVGFSLTWGGPGFWAPGRGPKYGREMRASQVLFSNTFDLSQFRAC